MERIILHWTAGTHSASAEARNRYHEIVEGDGRRVMGDYAPEANLDCTDGQYARHTRGLNTGSIGLSMAAMAGARERPFDAGKYPIMPVQLTAFCDMVAEYALTYDIPVTPRTVLTHAEVQPTLGVWQRQKWDITWLPGLRRPIDPIEAGDRLRALVAQEIERMRQPQPRPRAQVVPVRPILRFLGRR